MLTTQIGKVKLENPLMNASGTFGSGKEYGDFFDIRELGAVVSKSVTPRAVPGNSAPRVVEVYGGMLNAIGLQNEGLEYFINNLLPGLRGNSRNVIVNVAGKCEEDYEQVVRKLGELPECNGRPAVDALEINISCPNVKVGGMGFGTQPETAAKLVQRLRAATALPLWIKLSPNVTDITAIARAVESAGADALVVCNTFLGMAIDIEKRRPILANITGGMSGPAVHPLALRCVWQVAGAVKCPIIGCGGISSVREIVAFLMAGAAAVQVGMANFAEPAIMPRLLGELRDWCVEHHTTVREIIGAARPQ